MYSEQAELRHEASQLGDDVAIRVANLSKCYQIYDRPQDRLKQSILPRVQRLAGVPQKQYHREFWALKDVSFEVKKGETVGIIGRNGSGKSTLLQLICGTLAPTSGTIETKGRVAALLELGSGFNLEFTGRENVYLNGTVLGLSREEVDRRFDDIAAFADIGDFIDQPVKSYSSGMFVRLALSVVAHVDADILIIDEALAVGDAFFVQKCMRFLRKFMETRTVLFVSHDVGSIKNLCKSAIWLERGSIVQHGTPKAVCESYLEAFYESQQGRSTTTRMKQHRYEPQIAPTKDQRSDFLNSSNLRNDLQVFEFSPDTPSFGKAGAQIVDVVLLDKDGGRLSWIVGGERVTLRVTVKCHAELESPIVGFFVKDRLGQTLFGDNTYLLYKDRPLRCKRDATFTAEFSFTMPILPEGDYSISAAVADGNQLVHVQHHWIHDALLFNSVSSSVTTGLIGVPMSRIGLEILA